MNYIDIRFTSLSYDVIKSSKAYRNKRLGIYMIQNIRRKYGFKGILVKIDNDAVDFYKKCDFKVSNTIKKFDEKEMV